MIECDRETVWPLRPFFYVTCIAGRLAAQGQPPAPAPRRRELRARLHRKARDRAAGTWSSDLSRAAADAGRSGDHRSRQDAVRDQLPAVPRRGPARRRYGRRQPASLEPRAHRSARRAHSAGREGRAPESRHAVMPPFPQIPDDDVKAIAEYIHAVAFTMRGQGNPPPGAEPVVLNIVVGDASAGKAYFAAKCSSCHSATGDLQGVATRISDPVQLQNAWVAAAVARRWRRTRRPRRRRRRPTGARSPVTVTTAGRSEGRRPPRSHRRLHRHARRRPMACSAASRATATCRKSRFDDPLAGHRQLLRVYTDKDIHDVTAYLVTLK